jgi:hypothetical protein
MGGDLINLVVCAVLGFATVLIFQPERFWVRIAVGGGMGLLMWLVKVTTIWWSYHA